MGCFGGLVGCLLYLFNIVFFFCGAVVLGIGIWLEVDSSGLSISDVSIPSASSAGSIWSAAVAIFIAIGAFTLLVAFFGCCGVSKKSECMLGFYTGLVGLVLLLELTAGILGVVFQSKIDGTLEDEITSSLEVYYTDMNDITGPSISYNWNLVQSEWQCCGSESYTDYGESRFKQDNKNLTVPYECCVRKPGTKKSDLELSGVLNYTDCQLEAKNTGPEFTYLYSQGCYDKLKSWVKDHAGIVIGIGFAFAILQLLGLIFACCYKNNIKEHLYTV